MTQSLLRLRALLAVLSNEWEDRLELIRRAACYPDGDEIVRCDRDSEPPANWRDLIIREL